MRYGTWLGRGLTGALAALALAVLGPAVARAQTLPPDVAAPALDPNDPPPFPRRPGRQLEVALPPAPTAPSPSAPFDDLAGGAALAPRPQPAAPARPSLEQRLADLEAINRQLRLQVDDLSTKINQLPKAPAQGGEGEHSAVGTGGVVEPTISGQPVVTSTRPRKTSMYHIGWLWYRDDAAEIAGRGTYKPDMPAYEHEIGEGAFLGGPENGVTWQSKDKYFSLTFHNLSQLDMREPVQQGDPLHGGFIIPRQRWYFEGKVGDYATFVTSVNRGYASFDVLDSYVNFIVNPEWLEFRVGRMKTPSQYEYISIDEANLIGPERSIYVQSFAGNRQLGAMAHGRLFDRTIEYYAGMFNGPRRSFEDFNSGRDYFFYLDYRPFRNNYSSLLQGLHMVGTYNFGEERQPLSPFALRTMNQLSQSAAASFVSPTILEFAPGVFENGPREFWSYETVYYLRSWGFLSGVQGGYQDYSFTHQFPVPGRQNASSEFLGVFSPTRTHVPIMGWSFQTWYFLTGEEITRRRYLVEPRRPFGYYNGTINPGAIELFTKVSNLQLGSTIFSSGLVDPKLWTNRATAFEIGVNWYLTHFVKFAFDYQHTFLANPVLLDPSSARFTKGYDLFLFRTQLFF
jgi:phosphate-selective porin OprO/OprP